MKKILTQMYNEHNSLTLMNEITIDGLTLKINQSIIYIYIYCQISPDKDQSFMGFFFFFFWCSPFFFLFSWIRFVLYSLKLYKTKKKDL